MIKSKLSSGTGLLVLTYITFISLGLPDGLLGVAWPSMRVSFSRSLDSLGILLGSSTAGYLISSFYSGQALSRLGMGGLLTTSCAATGIGLIGYTIVPYWWMMIPLAVIAGLGAGAIDAGVNTYVASNYREKVMQWLHACYGIGITLGPIIMTAGINFFDSWRWGYIVVGSAQVFLALCFGVTNSVWKQQQKKAENDIPNQQTNERRITIFETLSQANVWLSILLFFFYTGIEALVGNWAYSLLVESRGIQPGLAGLWVGTYWATFTIGRILAGFFTKHIPIDSLIEICIITSLAGALLLMWNPFMFSSLIAVAIIGIAIAPIFPGLVSLTGSRVGQRYASHTIGMQISAAGLGVAILPGLTGVLAQHTSLEVIPIIIIICTIVLLLLYFTAARTKT